MKPSVCCGAFLFRYRCGEVNVKWFWNQRTQSNPRADAFILKHSVHWRAVHGTGLALIPVAWIIAPNCLALLQYASVLESDLVLIDVYAVLCWSQHRGRIFLVLDWGLQGFRDFPADWDLPFCKAATWKSKGTFWWFARQWLHGPIEFMLLFHCSWIQGAAICIEVKKQIPVDWVCSEIS